MRIERIPTQDVVFEIFDADNRFTHLQQCILAQKEVTRSKRTGEWKIQLVNGRDFSENEYTNPYDETEHFWIAGYDDDDSIVMLQLVSVEPDKSVELVNCEKHTSEKNVFGQIVEWTESEYPGLPIVTFPMTDRLEQYYMSKGFKKYEPNLSGYLVKTHG